MKREVKFVIDQGYSGGEDVELFTYDTDDYPDIKSMEKEIQFDYQMWLDERCTNGWFYTDEED